MNCQDIARILDEREVDQLLAEEQSGVQAHLATCRDCARAWRVHMQLSEAGIPAVPPELRALFPAQVAGVADAGARRRSRFVVVGALVAVAAAAAIPVLVGQMSGSQALVVAIVEPPQGASSGPPPAQGSGQVLPAAPEERAEEATQPATRNEQTPVVAANPAQLRIVLMPARHDSTEEAAKPAIDAFHSSLLRALRNIPDVALEVANGSGFANDQSANRVTVVSPRVTTLSSGRRIHHSGDGQRTWPGIAVGGTYSGPPRWAVEVILEPVIQRTPGNNSTVDQYVDGNGIPTGESCNINHALPNVVPPVYSNGLPAMCSSAEGLAAWLVAALRPQPAPQVSDTAQIISRLSDVSTYDRPGALYELLRRARQDGTVLDAAAIDAITAYLGSLTPEQKLSSLRSLHNVRQPGLVVPLLEFLQRDDDEEVRLEALSILVADHNSDSRARAAFETVALHDASRLVRMVAQRTLYGDAQWQPYVAATLADRSLSPADRLAPALYDYSNVWRYPGELEKIQSDLQSHLGSGEVTRQLLDIFQELRSETRQSGTDALSAIPSGLAARMAELGGQGVVNLVVTGVPPTEAPAGIPAEPTYGSGAGAETRALNLAGLSGLVATRSPGRQQQDEAMQRVVNLLAITNPSAAMDLRIRILTEDPQPRSMLTINALNALVERRDDPRVREVLDDIAAGKAGAELRNMLEGNMATRPQTDPSKSR